MNNIKRSLVRVVTTTLISVSFLLAGCEVRYSTQISATYTQAETFVILPSSVPTSTNTPEPVVLQEPTPTIETTMEAERAQYGFTVVLDYNKHTLNVQESISYLNETGRSLEMLELVVPPNQIDEVFYLKSLLVNNREFTDYVLEGNRLSIPLESALHDGDTVDISITYQLMPKYNAGVLSYTKNQMNISDWYPFIPPFDQEIGWMIHPQAEVGENLAYDKADFSVFLAVMGEQGVVVAASTEAVPVDVNMYKLESINARNLTFSVSDKYQELVSHNGSTTIRAYVFKGDESAGEAAIEHTGKALISFSALFGMAFPHETMTIVESDFPDGMEYDGLYYLSRTYFDGFDGTYQGYLPLLAVHETAHQWWLEMVGSDQAMQPWLDEMLATYSEYLYTEQFYPELTDWWWDYRYRVEKYNPQGWVDMTIYDETELRSYINTVYLQGASFLHELRKVLGDDAFFNGLRTYVAEYSDKNATWDDFLSVMGVDQSTEAGNVVSQYFRSY